MCFGFFDRKIICFDKKTRSVKEKYLTGLLFSDTITQVIVK